MSKFVPGSELPKPCQPSELPIVLAEDCADTDFVLIFRKGVDGGNARIQIEELRKLLNPFMIFAYGVIALTAFVDVLLIILQLKEHFPLLFFSPSFFWLY